MEQTIGYELADVLASAVDGLAKRITSERVIAVMATLQVLGLLLIYRYVRDTSRLREQAEHQTQESRIQTQLVRRQTQLAAYPHLTMRLMPVLDHWRQLDPGQRLFLAQQGYAPKVL